MRSLAMRQARDSGERCGLDSRSARNLPPAGAPGERGWPMIQPGRPVDEAERVAALRALGLLDTPSEERFDRITRRLAMTLSVPIAYVALIDSDRQWLKSKAGCMESETPRDLSFCAHTILEDEPLVVPDARLDARFEGNPMVTGEPYIRFYAGYPLATADGRNVGTLCVADQKARDVSESDLKGHRSSGSRCKRIHPNRKQMISPRLICLSHPKKFCRHPRRSLS